MKLGIVGSRRRDNIADFNILLKRVVELKPDMIISGGCPKGADRFAETIARQLGIPILIYHPRIERGKSYQRWEITKANYARNELIAKESDYLIALVAPDRKGGTENTIERFKFKSGGKTWMHKMEIL